MTKKEKLRRIAHMYAIETWGLGSKAVDRSTNPNCRENYWCGFLNPEGEEVGHGHTWDEAMYDARKRDDIRKGIAR